MRLRTDVNLAPARHKGGHPTAPSHAWLLGYLVHSGASAGHTGTQCVIMDLNGCFQATDDCCEPVVCKAYGEGVQMPPGTPWAPELEGIAFTVKATQAGFAILQTGTVLELPGSNEGHGFLASLPALSPLTCTEALTPKIGSPVRVC